MDSWSELCGSIVSPGVRLDSQQGVAGAKRAGAPHGKQLRSAPASHASGQAAHFGPGAFPLVRLDGGNELTVESVEAEES